MSRSQNDKVADYILVVKEENLPRIQLYLDNLKVLGLDFQNETGITLPLIFIKVYISDEALDHFSKLYEIGTEDSEVTPIFYSEPIFSTPFPNPIADTSALQKGEITDAEKITVINKVLENSKYGEKDNEFGLTKLINLKLIQDAYPLHDGPITEDGTNSRTLLYYYWSNTAVTHMQQPLDLVFQYFGNEVAFYFAWLEYFNSMLVIPAILGLITFILSLLYLEFGNPVEVREICQNQDALCPTCESKKGCRFKKLLKYCSLAKWSYVFDNNFTVAYAIFVSFWVTLFITLWRRKENKLKLRWNCVDDVREVQVRQAYLDKATHQHHNRITGEMEAYTPKLKKIYQYTVTITACACLFGIILLIVLMNMVLKIIFLRYCNTTDNQFLHQHAKLLTMSAGSLLQVICIRIFQQIYKPASIRLTKFENPRTQYDFDNSVLYKRYLLAFMNNYVPMIYLAFLKGRFVTMPHNMTFMRKDACQPCNCIVALCVQLTFIMTIKTLLGNVWSLVIPIIKKIFLHFKLMFFRMRERHRVILPQWEEEYYLDPLLRYSVTAEFSEMVIRYGYVSFFSKAFPLAAICALLNNLIELRSDAYKFVKSHRRPVPVEKSGIGAWDGILRSLCYFSTAVTAFVIAFTSDWVPREVYRLNKGKGSLVGYVNWTLSKYATADHKGYESIPNHPEFCYFRGHYYPPDSPDRYTRNQDYWLDLTFRFVTVFAFEHVVLVCNALLAYCISYKPESVVLQMDLSAHKAKEARLTECERKLRETTKGKLDLEKSIHGIHY